MHLDLLLFLWCADGPMKAKNWLKKRNVMDSLLEGDMEATNVLPTSGAIPDFDSNLFSLIFVWKRDTEGTPAFKHIRLDLQGFQIHFTFTLFCEKAMLNAVPEEKVPWRVAVFWTHGPLFYSVCSNFRTRMLHDNNIIGVRPMPLCLLRASNALFTLLHSQMNRFSNYLVSKIIHLNCHYQKQSFVVTQSTVCALSINMQYY